MNGSNSQIEGGKKVKVNNFVLPASQKTGILGIYSPQESNIFKEEDEDFDEVEPEYVKVDNVITQLKDEIDKKQEQTTQELTQEESVGLLNLPRFKYGFSKEQIELLRSQILNLTMDNATVNTLVENLGMLQNKERPEDKQFRTKKLEQIKEYRQSNGEYPKTDQQLDKFFCDKAKKLHENTKPNPQKVVDAILSSYKTITDKDFLNKPEYKYHLSDKQKRYINNALKSPIDILRQNRDIAIKDLQNIDNNLNGEIEQIKQKATAITPDEEDLLKNETQRLFKLKMVEVYRDVKGQYPQTDEELDKFIVSDLKQDLKTKLNKYREKAMHYNANFKIEDTGGVVTDYREKNFNTDVFNGVLTKYNNIISKIPANDNEYNIDRLQRALNEINSDLTKLNGVYEWAVVKKELNIAQPLDKNMVDKLNDFIKQRQKLRGLIEINSPDSKTANELYNKKRAEIYNNNFNPSLEDKVKEVNNKITNEFDKIKTDIKADLVKCLSFVQPNKDTKELKQQAEKFINDNINQGTDIDKIKAFKDKIQNTYNAMDEFYDKKVDLHNLQNQENPEIEIDKNQLAEDFLNLTKEREGLPSPSKIKSATEKIQKEINELEQKSADELRGTLAQSTFYQKSGGSVNQSRLGAGAGEDNEFKNNNSEVLNNISNQSSIVPKNHGKNLKEQNNKNKEAGAGIGS